jgi:hypothetical protein
MNEIWFHNQRKLKVKKIKKKKAEKNELIVFIVCSRLCFNSSSQLETTKVSCLPTQSFWNSSLAPLPEDLWGWKINRIFQLNSNKVVKTRKESNENRRVVLWRAEMGEEGLGKRSRPKKDRGLKGVGNKTT